MKEDKKDGWKETGMEEREWSNDEWKERDSDGTKKGVMGKNRVTGRDGRTGLYIGSMGKVVE